MAFAIPGARGYDRCRDAAKYAQLAPYGIARHADAAAAALQFKARVA